MTTSSRPQRADARRNREKILEAARLAFAEHGLSAQMEDIATRAEVGVGTLYRHFPTKDALLSELVFAHFTALAEAGGEALASDAEPWEALSGWLWFCAGRNHDDRSLAEVLAARPAEETHRAAETSGLHDVSTQLIERAKAAGVVRADAEWIDVPIVMCGLGAVLQSHKGPDAWKRYFTLVLDGLRAGAR